MKNEVNKEKSYLILGIALTILVLMGVSYAFFSASIVGDRKNVSVDMADLKIIFTNGDAIEAKDISAEDNLDIVKSFSVENKTKNVYKYNIVIEDLVNTFKTTGFLVYKITSTDGGYNMTDFKDVPKSLNPFNTGLAYNITIPANTKHNYNIEIKYINSETVNQSADSNAVLSGKLYIEKGTNPTLSYVMLRDNPTISERTDFRNLNVKETTGTIYQTNKTEDDSYVYYYSGNTTNNWVKFGNFYWRIIRTNEDGSVRLLYSGTSPDNTTGYIENSKYNANYDEPMYVGYMYGTSGSLENNRTNENDSDIKKVVDTWYQNYLLNNYDKYISKSAIYCNDRSIPYGQKYTTSKSEYFYFGSEKRVYENASPSYKCGANTSNGLFENTQAIADKFSASTEGGGNGKLTYPIALMTADELNFAGGSVLDTATTNLWYYTNSEGESITGNFFWWTMSPVGCVGSESRMWYSDAVETPSQIYFTQEITSTTGAIRPTISLDSCVTIKSGYGTPESPYEIDESSCS